MQAVHLAHPLKVRAIAEARIKTDRIDSRILAHLLRCDLLPTAYVRPKEQRTAQQVLRQRMLSFAKISAPRLTTAGVLATDQGTLGDSRQRVGGRTVNRLGPSGPPRKETEFKVGRRAA